MILAMECSVLGCNTLGYFIGKDNQDVRTQARKKGWIHEDPFDECRCPKHAVGKYKMKEESF